MLIMIYYMTNSGCSVMSILHFINKIPVGWYSNNHSAVNTSIYGYDFFSICTCVEYMIDFRNTLWYPGVPITQKIYMCVYSISDVDSAIDNHVKIHKCCIEFSCIESGRLLRIILFPYTVYMWKTIHLMSHQIIVVTVIIGSFFSHYCYILGIL